MPRPLSRRLSIRGRRMLAAAVILGVLSTTACVSAPPRPTPTGNLRLTLGTLLPVAAGLGEIGPRTQAAVALAVADIAAARAGITVTTVPRDGSSDSAGAVTELLSAGVSGVIGSASSGLAKGNMERFARAGVVQISPSEGATELTTSPDAGLFWRTAPTDSLRGRALGNQILSDGALRVGILYANDSAGSATESGLVDALAEGGAASIPEIFEPGASDFTGALDRILLMNPDALVVISGPELQAIAAQLSMRAFDLKKLYGIDRNVGVLENGAVDAAGARFAVAGAPTSPALAARLPPLGSSSDATVVDRSFSPEAYDAAVLLALAALEAQSTEGRALASRLRDVSSGGVRCVSFAACSRMIAAGTDINFDGQSGKISWNDHGDVTVAQTRIFRLAGGNVPVLLKLESSER